MAKSTVKSAWVAFSVAKESHLLHTDSKEPDQTSWMHRLIWVVAVRTWFCRFCFAHPAGLFVCNSFPFLFLSDTEDYKFLKWTASSEFGTYRICEQRRFRRACASAQSRQNLRCSLIQAVSQEEPSDRNQIPGPSDWLGMRSQNVSWRNARRHKFAWRGPKWLLYSLFIKVLSLICRRQLWMFRSITAVLTSKWCRLQPYWNLTVGCSCKHQLRFKFPLTSIYESCFELT